jgi:hypothetical protein
VPVAQNEVAYRRLPDDEARASFIESEATFEKRRLIMKALLCTTLALALAAPVMSFAQTTDEPVTRAQVRADLVQLENAGWRPNSQDAYYPSDIQAAEARVHSGDTAATGYGGATENGTSMSQPSAGGAAVAPVYKGQ